MHKWKLNKRKLDQNLDTSFQGDEIFKRRFRWSFEFDNIKGNVVKSLKLPIRAINKDGLPLWSGMTVEYYDICGEGYNGLWDYILQDKFEVRHGILNYYSGTGDVIHSLELLLRPNEIEVSEPDYSANAESTVKIYFDVLNILQRNINEGKIPKSKSRRRLKPKTVNL